MGAECRILARLSHPNIARLLDAGFTPEGSPYLVMEYVEGAPVTVACDERRLDVAGRLRVFQAICAATQHAHQSLVVHRDLKPSNVFVSAAGEVKLLDFGIAKLLDPADGDVNPTAHELRAFTPGYAAPEQARGEPVTTATDVYVLGVVLYELLVGKRPVDTAAGRTLPGVPAATLDTAAVPPSEAIRRAMSSPVPGARAETTAAAARRQTTPGRLARRLAGDLDRVVLTALHDSPARRYASAGQLSEDVARVLGGRPILAQPDTLSYRVRRFVGRHRVAVTAAALTAALVLAFTAVTIAQARAVAVERDRAQAEAARARRVATLVADLFTLADPSPGRGGAFTARELLDSGLARIDAGLAGDPETQVTLYAVLGRVYGSLGLHRDAIAVLGRGLALERGAPPDGSPDRSSELLHQLGQLYSPRERLRGSGAMLPGRLGQASPSGREPRRPRGVARGARPHAGFRGSARRSGGGVARGPRDSSSRDQSRRSRDDVAVARAWAGAPSQG